MVYENDIYVKYSAAKDTLHNNMEENAKLIIIKSQCTCKKSRRGIHIYQTFNAK